MRLWTSAALAVLTLAVPLGVHAQEFPDRQIRLVVPYSAGGLVDISGRMIANSLAEQLGQPVVVENRPGGFGMIAVESVVTSDADGYTLLMDTMGVAMNSSMHEAPYDPLTDLQPIGMVMSIPFAIAANNSIGVSGYEEFIALAKENPGMLNAATAGTSTHLATALFGLQADIDFEFVHYQGAAPSKVAVLNGESDFIAIDLANLAEHIETGEMVGILVTGDERSAATPNVPTAGELGLTDFNISTWFSIFAPAGTPEDVVEALNAALLKAVATPAFEAFVNERGAQAGNNSVSEFETFFESEVARWKLVVDEAGIEVN